MFLVFLFLAVFGIYLGLYINFGQAIFFRERLADAMPKPDGVVVAAPAEPEQETV